MGKHDFTPYKHHHERGHFYTDDLLARNEDIATGAASTPAVHTYQLGSLTVDHLKSMMAERAKLIKDRRKPSETFSDQRMIGHSALWIFNNFTPQNGTIEGHFSNIHTLRSQPPAEAIQAKLTNLELGDCAHVYTDQRRTRVHFNGDTGRFLDVIDTLATYAVPDKTGQM